MHILLTGASSFLGRSIVPALARAGHRIYAVWHAHKANYKQDQFRFLQIDLIQADLSDIEVYATFPDRIDAIIHIAAVSSKVHSIYEFIQNNVTGMKNIIEFTLNKKVKYLIYSSSLSIHGHIEDTVVTEKTPIINPDMYGMSKYIAELLLRENASNLNSIAIRLPGVLGIGAHRHWLSTVFTRAKNDDDISIFNPDAPFNNAVHVCGLAEFINNLLERKWHGFHAMPLGAGGQTTIKGAVERIILKTKSASRVIIKQEEKSSFIISSQYAKDTFQYTPMNIDDMIDKYVDENIFMNS